MSALNSKDVLRPAKKGLAGLIERTMFAALPRIFTFLRRWKPIAKLGNTYLTSRYDDVREVFATDQAFGVVYRPKLDIIMAGEPFFLGMGETEQYHAAVDAMRAVVLPEDFPRLAHRVATQAAAIVDGAPGQIEVVDTLVRRTSFDVLADYFGVPEPNSRNLDVWCTRLFEFQFVGSMDDKALRAEVDEIAPALRDHIDREIARRKIGSHDDDVLSRCLAKQKAGAPGYSDVQIRTALMGMVVGGPPQPPMVVPQALEQLLRRPKALAGAQAAARADDDALLAAYIREAMRFDPLAPGLPRVALRDATIAAGTPHAQTLPKGAQVLAAFASAMQDPRRVANPTRFDAHRPDSDYIHFGHGLHQCFGMRINAATLHLMVKPILKQNNLRRAAGRSGHLRKNGPFAASLSVAWG